MVTRSAEAAAARMAQSVPLAENEVRVDLRHVTSTTLERVTAAASGEAVPHRSSAYGLPCARCRLYYAANLDVCPTCKSTERVSANVVPVIPKAQASAEPVPDDEALEQERQAFLKEFKSQLFAAHAEVTNSPALCTNERHLQAAEVASICRPCYDRLQERLDICEAALHIDLKDAAQIVYDAVWADPSDPTKTYNNAANALLTELRRRAGISAMIGPFQPLGN